MTTTATSVDEARDFSAKELDRRLIEHRAFEAVIWGMPIVNYDLNNPRLKARDSGSTEVD